MTALVWMLRDVWSSLSCFPGNLGIRVSLIPHDVFKDNPENPVFFFLILNTKVEKNKYL